MTATNRQALRTGINASAAFLAMAAASATVVAADQKPNVLFIAIDDLRDWVQYLDKNTQVQTPNLDRLAARGLRFTHSYCAACSAHGARFHQSCRCQPTMNVSPRSMWKSGLLGPVTSAIMKWVDLR
jgi:hypothetical protein